MTAGGVVTCIHLLSDSPYLVKLSLANRLLSISSTTGNSPKSVHALTVGVALGLQKRKDLFDSVAYYHPEIITSKNGRIGLGNLLILRASSSFFDALGAEPILGRVFHTNTTVDNSLQPIVISYSTWEEFYNRSSSALGSILYLRNRPFIVIGVMPKLFRFPYSDVSAWIPNEVTIEEMEAGGLWQEETFARVRPGVDENAVRQGLTEEAEVLIANDPRGNRNLAFELKPLWIDIVGSHAIVVLSILSALLCFLNLTIFRMNEISSRNQLLIRTEVAQLKRGNTLLSSISHGYLTIAGPLFVLAIGTDYLFFEYLKTTEVSLSGLYTKASAASDLLYSILITIFLTMMLMRPVGAGRAHISQDTNRTHRVYSTYIRLAVEASLMIMILSWNVSTLREVWIQHSVDRGFNPGGILVAQLSVDADSVTGNAFPLWQQQELIKRITGVPSIGIGTHMPFSGVYNIENIRVVGGNKEISLRVQKESVNAEYFSTLKIPVQALPRAMNKGGNSCSTVVNKELKEAIARQNIDLREAVVIERPGGVKVSCDITGVIDDIRDGGGERAPLGKIYFVSEYDTPSQCVLFLPKDSVGGPTESKFRSLLTSQFPGIRIRTMSSLAALRPRELANAEVKLFVLTALSLIAVTGASLGCLHVTQVPMPLKHIKCMFARRRIVPMGCIFVGFSVAIISSGVIEGMMKTISGEIIESSAASWFVSAIALLILCWVESGGSPDPS